MYVNTFFFKRVLQASSSDVFNVFNVSFTAVIVMGN